MKRLTLTPEQTQKFLKNALKFFAPGIAIFFTQLQMGASYQVAMTTALLVCYGLLADYFSKLEK